MSFYSCYEALDSHKNGMATQLLENQGSVAAEKDKN